MPASDPVKEKEDHADAVPERTMHDSGARGTPDLRLLHFNDVYHPHSANEEPQGGAARFKTVCEYYRNDSRYQDAPKALTFFSGDAFNPSHESSVTKGSHMVPILNELKIDAACVGNHEFDFGAAHFAYLAKDCNFPWLLSNLFDPDLGEKKPLGHCEESKILRASNGLSIGLLALVEKEWTEKINNSLPSDIEHFDMSETARRIGPCLRKQGADIVIAITHARQPRDFEFCRSLEPGVVDLVLAGHDHWVEHKEFSNGVVILRSGYDFKNLTYTECYRREGRWKFNIIRRNLTGDIEEDPTIRGMCDDITKDIQQKMEQRLGFTAVPLEARKQYCQTQETNFGNFLADLIRLYHDADCALLNGGTFYADKTYSSGELYVKDIVQCFPFEDPIVKLSVTGKAIKEALENGVSRYPEADSRFPQVSNIFFTFNPECDVGSRVTHVTIGGEKLDMEHRYTIATRSHLAAGKAGYGSLKSRRDGGEAEEVIDEENGVLVTGLLRQYFTWLAVTAAFRVLAGGEREKDSHRKKVISGLGRHSQHWHDEKDKSKVIAKKVIWKWKRLALGRSDLMRMMREGDGEFFAGWTRGIAPLLEGRIKVDSDRH